jgi:hypothetical protein
MASGFVDPASIGMLSSISTIVSFAILQNAPSFPIFKLLNKSLNFGFCCRCRLVDPIDGLLNIGLQLAQLANIDEACHGC